MAKIRTRAKKKKSASKKKASSKKSSTKTTPANKVLASVQKKRKKVSQSARTMSDAPIVSDVSEWISTGFPTLDRAFGGGWPVGRASEVYGPEASGKTALAHLSIKEAQRMGGFGLVYDYEVAMEKEKIEQLGIDPDNLIYAIPDHMEQGFDLLNAFLDHIEQNPPEGPVAIVWDSVAMASTKEEVEKGSEDSMVSPQARVMSRQAASHALKKKIARCRAHVLFINQPRQKIGASTFEDPETTPGGNALNFLADLRVRTKRIATLPQKGKPKHAYMMRASTVKNKVAPPYRSGDFVIDFEHGPSRALTAFEHLRREQIIKASQGQYSLTKGVEWRGSRGDFHERYRRQKTFRQAVDKLHWEAGY